MDEQLVVIIITYNLFMVLDNLRVGIIRKINFVGFKHWFITFR